MKNEAEEISDLKKQLQFWEERASDAKEEANYYRGELVKAHTLLGRVIQQLSERWDTVNLTEHFPTSNLHRRRTVSNPTGGSE